MTATQKGSAKPDTSGDMGSVNGAVSLQLSAKPPSEREREGKKKEGRKEGDHRYPYSLADGKWHLQRAECHEVDLTAALGILGPAHHKSNHLWGKLGSSQADCSHHTGGESHGRGCVQAQAGSGVTTQPCPSHTAAAPAA